MTRLCVHADALCSFDRTPHKCVQMLRYQLSPQQMGRYMGLKIHLALNLVLQPE